ncbi:MAG: sugar phosphate isomerase/epimerase [Bacteroidales bacterium]|nr:sugar phosphate isomerase/epimerase [Bacteroidales bacterium]
MIGRRKFIYSAAIITGMPGILSTMANNNISGIQKAGTAGFELGVISSANNPEEDLKKVRDLGFSACQLSIESYSSGLADRLVKTLDNYKIKPTALICMGPGVYKWNLVEGPSTIGLVPREMRAERVKRLYEGIDFCKTTGIPSLHAHFGFIPENPKDILYIEFIETMKPIGAYALKHGIDILFETGQETPVTLLRAITDIGTGNLFVNYDPANLVMYGKANPSDGLKVIGQYVRGFHAKDGTYPVNPNELGKEVPIPEGEVDFPAIFATLKQLNYPGTITIECELANQKSDYILKTKNYLNTIIAKL